MPWFNFQTFLQRHFYAGLGRRKANADCFLTTIQYYFWDKLLHPSHSSHWIIPLFFWSLFKKNVSQFNAPSGILFGETSIYLGFSETFFICLFIVEGTHFFIDSLTIPQEFFTHFNGCSMETFCVRDKGNAGLAFYSPSWREIHSLTQYVLCSPFSFPFNSILRLGNRLIM